MLNLLSLFIGAVSLLLAIPAFLPFLGILNWFILPIPIIGLGIGVLSRKTTGRNLNIVALLVIIVRLSLGGGLL